MRVPTAYPTTSPLTLAWWQRTHMSLRSVHAHAARRSRTAYGREHERRSEPVRDDGVPANAVESSRGD
jgi:hypothetical protein